MVSTVVFDLDDTLYDEVDYCISGFKAVSQCLVLSHPNYQADKVFDIFWDEFSSGNRDKVFNKTLERLGIESDKRFINSLVEVYRQHKPEIALPEQSRVILEEFSQKYKLALLTDGFLPAQELKVESLDIAKYFDSIIYTESLGRKFWKPSTAGFEKICQELGSPCNQCVYIADNAKKDFAGPNKLGFAATIQLIRPRHLHSFKSLNTTAKPKYVIHDLDQLRDIIENIK